MKYLFVNTVCGIGSTGKICCETAEDLCNNGNECIIAYGRGKVPDEYQKFAYKIGNVFSVLIHLILTPR